MQNGGLCSFQYLSYFCRECSDAEWLLQEFHSLFQNSVMRNDIGSVAGYKKAF